MCMCASGCERERENETVNSKQSAGERQVLDRNFLFCSLQVRWEKDGLLLNHSMKYRIKGLKRQLRINKIEGNDTGTYHCIGLVNKRVQATAKLWGE